MAATTFKELGLEFDTDGKCDSCLTENCINNVESKIDGKEYNVHISTNQNQTMFRVHATENTSTSSDSDIDEDFETEKETVEFVCKNFHGFKCA